MSEEDRAFLERVMQEGIIDENKRMNEILKTVTETMEKWKEEPANEQDENDTYDLLQELRDIVEQIDFARAFAAMKGLNFLLGCVQEREHLPRSIRVMALGILATMCQHNPPVQKELLDMGSLRILSELFFQENDQTDADGTMRARLIQAISANVRSHDIAEIIFCQLEQSRQLIEEGIGVNKAETPLILQKRALFFLRALLTSDSATRERIQRFGNCLVWVMDHLLDNETCESQEIREIALAMTVQILEQKKSVNAILSRRDSMVAIGARRVASMRALSGEAQKMADDELEYWENCLRLLARTTPDQIENPSHNANATPRIGAPPYDTFAQ